MKSYTSYGKGVKSISFDAFKKAHKDIPRFENFSETEWEKEYKKATGKEVKKKNEGE
jgi:hypothetical protein